jgi:hypothetical protein
MPMSVPIVSLLGSVLMPHLVKPENIVFGFWKQSFEITFNSGHSLMGSQLMGSFRYWDQIEPDFPVPKTLIGT